MIEADSKTPSLPVLRNLAKVLGVRRSALVGEAPSEAHEGPVNPRLAEVERALFTYRSLSLTDSAELPTLDELGEQISAAQQAWYTSPSKYSDVLREPARKAALRVGDGHNYHNTVFGPTNAAIHMVSVESEAGEISEALRLADKVDLSQVPSLERKTSHLYQVARCYDCRNNDAAIFVHLKMAEQLCPQEFQHKRNVRSMVSTLVKRAKPSYAPEVREFAGRIGLLN